MYPKSGLATLALAGVVSLRLALFHSFLRILLGENTIRDHQVNTKCE